MSYSLCLEKAGCEIIAFQEFGSWQGEWLAFVELNGEKGIVAGSYGSCSGCDAFQAEFGWSDAPTEAEGKYYRSGSTWDEEAECTKEEFDAAVIKYEQRLADFGKNYLAGGLYNKAHFEQRLANIDSSDYFSEEERESIQWALNQNW